jgi:hypothetical protein
LERFYNALRGNDIAGGFLNRFLIVEDQNVVEVNRSHAQHSKVPTDLERALKALYKPRKKAETPGEVLDEPIDPSFEPEVKMTWGPGAEAASFDLDDSVTAYPDPRRQAIFARAAEKAAKIASIVAFCDDRTVVELVDFEWAKAWVLESDETLLAGVNKYSVDPQDFAALCRLILEFVKGASGRQASMRNLKRKFATLIKNGKDVTGALQYLAECECIALDYPPVGARGGRTSTVVKWLADLTDEDAD